jgi:hypothetical protein
MKWRQGFESEWRGFEWSVYDDYEFVFGDERIAIAEHTNV